jgi:hypothetical protein
VWKLRGKRRKNLPQEKSGRFFALGLKWCIDECCIIRGMFPFIRQPFIKRSAAFPQSVILSDSEESIPVVRKAGKMSSVQ